MLNKLRRLTKQEGKQNSVSQRRRRKAFRVEQLEPRQLLAADPASSLSSLADQPGMATSTPALSAADFQYLGATKASVGAGYEFGLAYRPSTNTFFTIGNAGRAPYDLLELSVPTGGGKATLVKDWGPIDPTGQLGTSGAVVRMEGLLWDDGKLWISWGSYYNADHSNDECLAYVTFGDGTMNLHGPWGVQASVGSDNVRGGIALAPKELTAITGQKFISFAGKGSTSQDESWGPSLSSFANPAWLPAGGQTRAEELTHWPMLARSYADPNGGRINDYYSAFPRITGDSVVRIIGNDNVIPGVRPSYQYNLRVTDNSFTTGDGIFAGAWIQEPGIDGLVYFGRQSQGYAWYGNAKAHDDTSAAGKIYRNDLGITDTADPNRGSHAQTWNWTVDFVSAASVLDTAEKVKQGTAKPADLEEQPTSIVNMTTLGGNVPLPRAAAGSIAGVYFDQQTSTLYVLEDYGQMLAWHVGAPQLPPITNTPVPVAATAVIQASAQLNMLPAAAVDLVMSDESSVFTD